MGPDADMYKEYMEIGIYRILFVNEEYLLITLYPYNNL